jgi:hypothetical protein
MYVYKLFLGVRDESASAAAAASWLVSSCASMSAAVYVCVCMYVYVCMCIYICKFGGE